MEILAEVQTRVDDDKRHTDAYRLPYLLWLLLCGGLLFRLKTRAPRPQPKVSERLVFFLNRARLGKFFLPPVKIDVIFF